MFAKVAAFEFRHQARSPLFWIVSGVFFLLVFGFMASDQIHISDTANVHKNGPFSIGQTHLIMALFYMFVATAFVAGAVTRDDETGFGPIVRATPMSKFDYLYGRFAGAFAAVALSFLAVTTAMMVGALPPWLDPDGLGPFRGDAYAFAYFVLALPSLFFTSALFFAVASWAKSMAWTFVAVIAVIALYVIANIAFGKPDVEPLLARWDPFGLFAFDVATTYWTAADRNTLLPAFHGAFLFNRLFTLGLGLGFLALAYPLCRYREAPGRALAAPPAPSAAPAMPAAAPAPIAPRFGGKAALAQFVARTRFDIGQVVGSPVFWVILGLGLANAAGALWSTTDDTPYGGALLPVTRILIPVLDGSFRIFAMVIAAYYAGELVWRDRDRRVHEMIDATPAPDWTFVIPKTAAVALVLIATVLASIAAALIVQAAKGYYHFELGKYLLWYLVPQSADLIVLAALAVFLQTLSPSKFVGWGLMLLYIVALFALPGLGVEHNLIVFGGVNPVPLSDMNGQGRFWIGAWWFRLYWGAASLILLIAAYALWRRGTETRFSPRLARAPDRLKGPAGVLAVASVAVLLGSGAFIFLNTDIWNPYRTQIGDDRWMAAYERTLLPYETVPQPSVIAVRLNVVIDPRRPMLEARGDYVLENKTAAPLRRVHVRFARDLEVRALSVQGARAIKTYERFNYRIFTFDTPMAPGERRTLAFDTLLTERGFRTSRRVTRDLTSVVANGTFVDSIAIAPAIGMTRDNLLTDRAKRRKYGLPAELHRAPLGDEASRANSYIGHGGWVSADITVTTDADQTPIAPGYKVFDEIRGARRTARFVTEAPILQFFSIQSARYAVRAERYKGIELAVYFDPAHGANVARMLRALEASLDYYQANFSPYQFRQARIVEFPDYAQFAQSFAGTFPWSEGLGFIADCRDPRRIDLVTYVAAHEFAHQWWAHQIVGADQQGATVLSETLAQYSALRVMRRLYGPDQIRKFLKYELDGYLRNRGGEAAAEQPLEKVEDQGYIHYRKGSLVMDRLADEIGEAQVNRALRSLLARFAFKGAPYPTALDLVAALRAQAPPDKQALITDLFEKITLYDVKATAATARRRADGRYDVRLTVQATKFHADGKGKETPAPMNETVDVGLFAAKPDTAGFGPRQVIAFGKRPIRSGAQTLTFVTRAPPRFAGVDPYDELIDRHADDHIVAVK
ncbi:MAG: ABC transporter permease subunit [Pseudomonadota bacterium]|nr:ABC transporter permease subunit [Pseudomonadota bacterium]